jgi:hypothetical protein
MDQGTLFVVLHRPEFRKDRRAANSYLWHEGGLENCQENNTIWFEELKKCSNLLLSSIKNLTIIIPPGKINQNCKILDDSFPSNNFLERLTYVWVSSVGTRLGRLTPYLNVSAGYDEIPRFLNKNFRCLRLEAFPYEGYIPAEQHSMETIRLSKDIETIELCDINCFVVYFFIPQHQESSRLSSIIIITKEATPLGEIAFYGDGAQQIEEQIKEGLLTMTWKVIETQETIITQEPERVYFTVEDKIVNEESVKLEMSGAINWRKMDGTEIDAMFLDLSEIFSNYNRVGYQQWGPTGMAPMSFGPKFVCCADTCFDG